MKPEGRERDNWSTLDRSRGGTPEQARALRASREGMIALLISFSGLMILGVFQNAMRISLFLLFRSFTLQSDPKGGGTTGGTDTTGCSDATGQWLRDEFVTSCLLWLFSYFLFLLEF